MLKLSLQSTFSRSLSRCLSITKTMQTSDKIDPQQEAALNERCFVVDENDKILGTKSKKECHQVQPNGECILHRAFSVFLFNKDDQLLLQKRSDEKVTFPGHYTNSCCSHPIADVPGEDNEVDAIGIKRAAQRRLNYELGIPINDIPLEKFIYLTRVHYKDSGNGVWGEHEIDYILFLRENVTLNPNSNEISEISFIPRKELDEHIKTLNPLTPWFELILKNRLRLWWDNLDNLDKFKEHSKILKLN